MSEHSTSNGGTAATTAVYEGLFLFDSNRFARDRMALPKEVEGWIASYDGEVLVSRLWEERRLAYAIKGQRKGAYWLIYFRLPTLRVTELSRQCKIHDHILRQLFVRLPEKLVEPIVEHAKGAPTLAPAAPSKPEIEVPDDEEIAAI